MKEYLVNKKDENQTLEKYIRKTLYFLPLSFIYKLFRKKDIKVNRHWGKRDYIVKENDTVSIYIKDEDFGGRIIGIKIITNSFYFSCRIFNIN